MFFHVDTANGIPIYVQLVSQIKSCIAGGILLDGDRMPSVRELAAQLTVNPNTIQKAYQELEQAGIIRTERGRGTFVCVGDIAASDEQRYQKMDERIQALLVEAYHLNFSKDELLHLVQEKLQSWDGARRDGDNE